MDPKVFLQNACPLCGTQRCYGQEEDLEHCGMWNTVKDLPNKAAMEAIQIAAHNPYQTLVEVVRDLAQDSSDTNEESKTGLVMTKDEIEHFISSVRNRNPSDTSTLSFYIDGILASCIALGYDEDWINEEFRGMIEHYFADE